MKLEQIVDGLSKVHGEPEPLTEVEAVKLLQLIAYFTKCAETVGAEPRDAFIVGSLRGFTERTLGIDGVLRVQESFR